MNENPELLKELKEEVSRFPKLPGVYIMRDQHGEVIYVGKARELRSRVRSYFGIGDGRYQIQYLMGRVSSIEKIVTSNEEEAFILERDLITRFKPRYNIRLKDDKSYLSVRVDMNDPWPRIETVRKVQQDGALYFGPCTSSIDIKSVLDVIRNVVPLRSCTDTVFFNRQRPCLEHQIKRCAGPCCLPVPPGQYMEWVEQAVDILRGKGQGVLKDMEAKMEEAAVELRFEDAALLRDRIEILRRHTAGTRDVAAHQGESRDAFALYREGSCAVVCVLKVRFGRISDSENFSFDDLMISDDELLESVISQYYERSREIPDEVLIPFAFENAGLVEKAVRQRHEATVEFVMPKIGSKARLVRLAELNAKQEFASRFDSDALYDRTSKEMAGLLSLRQIPRRVECIDISNLQGTDIVGAVAVFYDGVAQKNSYKKFKIHSEGKPDDFAGIHEVMTRRLHRASEEDDMPDLIIIDGGPGQLEAARKARDEAGVDVELISIAKMRAGTVDESGEGSAARPERVFLEGAKEAIPLVPGDRVTHFLQRVRDEVHRFVITFHRKRRSSRSVKSVLDDIPGIGPDRKRRLFSAFGSIEKMKDADPQEVARAGRMPLPLAEKLLRVIRG